MASASLYRLKWTGLDRATIFKSLSAVEKRNNSPSSQKFLYSINFDKMKFPLGILNSDEYLKNISELLEDKDCIVFIDTNILALLFKIYESARLEFFNWADPLIETGRLKTPVWTLNEYSKHFMTARTNEYFSSIHKVGSSLADFEEAKNFLRMNIDDESLFRSSYTDAGQFKQDLDLISEKLEKVKKVAKSKSLDYVLKVHAQIQTKFETTILQSDVFKIVENLQSKASSRFYSQLPPGFMDVKDFNSNGDLIIWNEILEYARLENIKKVIILTNDNKKDWMYVPQKIKIGSHTSSNQNPPLKIVDPRLVYEFKLATGSEELSIINFETLTKELVKRNDNRYLELARALQLVTEQVVAEEAKTEIEELLEIEEVPTTSAEEVSAQTVEHETIDPPQVNALPYSANALADAHYELELKSPLSTVIHLLKSHDWYRQNDGINDIKPSVLRVPEITQQVKDGFFVLGRNVYQAACGGAFQAIQFLENLEDHLSQFPSELATPLLSGIFYEIYFDSNGSFRAGDFKTGQLENVFDVQTRPFAASSIDFINQALEPYEDHLIVKPSLQPETITLELRTRVEDDDYLQGKFNVVESLEYKGVSLLKPYIPATSHLGYYFDSEKQLKVHIRNKLAIPSNQLQLIYKNEISETTEFHLLITTAVSKAELATPEHIDPDF